MNIDIGNHITFVTVMFTSKTIQIIHKITPPCDLAMLLPQDVVFQMIMKNNQQILTLQYSHY